jgi:phosphatidylserine decarboxylase
MTIHKEGYSSIAICVLIIAVSNAVIQFYLPQYHGLQWFVYILSFVFFVIIVQFFRSPYIKVVQNETQVLSPADGKVVVIEETTETEYLDAKCIQISVFMSPINVHVNRNPISGIVKYFKYHPGKYLVAWHPKSCTENERTTIVTENNAGVKVLFRQIAGALARRIVWYVREGDEVQQGAQFGFIKFGSRVDIYIPLGSSVKVAIGEKVKGGKTILAELIAKPAKEKIKVAAVKETYRPTVAANMPSATVGVVEQETVPDSLRVTKI